MAEPVYRDLDFTFKSHPLTKDLATTVDDVAIKSALKNLVKLLPYDKPFSPQIASPLYELLFEPIDEPTATIMEVKLSVLIRNYEPRIKDLVVTVVPLPSENKYSVDLEFTIKKIESKQQLQVFLPIERLR